MGRRKTPMRKCLACQEMKPKKDLVRVVHRPDGGVQVDPGGKVSGRGAYVCPRPACLEKVLKGKLLDRALGRELPPEVRERLALGAEGSPRD
ncbi:MAG: YlxR family protein [bacterium]|nr:YlxR family protein [bacterium]